MNNYPLRHLSIRVPWHDAGWAGVVRQAPQLNGSCAKLKRIRSSLKRRRYVTCSIPTLVDLPIAKRGRKPKADDHHGDLFA